MKTDKIKVLWTSTYSAATLLDMIESRRPDIVVVGKEDRVCKIIDVAVPADCRVKSKESGKILKHVKAWLNFWSRAPAKIKLSFLHGHAF